MAHRFADMGDPDDERLRLEEELRRLQEDEVAQALPPTEEAMRQEPMRRAGDAAAPPMDAVDRVQPGTTLGELMAPPADLQPQRYDPGGFRDFRPKDEAQKLQPMPMPKPTPDWTEAYRALQQSQIGSATGQYAGTASARARPSARGRAMGARRGMR